MQKVLIIAGPTAVGKTALSLELAKQFSGEIISGDSMQVYRKLDIGTAKATPAEQRCAPHHLLDICDVSEQYTAARFQKEAYAQIKAIAERQHLPIIVGGTGFYLQALVDGLQLGAKDTTNGKVKARIMATLQQIGSEKLWQRLNFLDSAAAAKIPPQNGLRIVRALEVMALTGRRFSAQTNQSMPLDFKVIALTCSRALLYQRINQRVDLMMQEGLVAEAKWLNDQGGLKLPAGKAIGYKELFPYFAGEQTLDGATALIKRNSRRYAKRQMTWFRNKMTPEWYNLVEHPEQKTALIENITTWINQNN